MGLGVIKHRCNLPRSNHIVKSMRILQMILTSITTSRDIFSETTLPPFMSLPGVFGSSRCPLPRLTSSCSVTLG